MNAQIIVVSNSKGTLNVIDSILYEIANGKLSFTSDICELFKSAHYIHTDANFLEISKMIRDETRSRK